jgi:hypothetical protein
MRYQYTETTFEIEMPKLLRRLRALEFEPTARDLEGLYDHLKNSIENSNRDAQLQICDRLTIPDVVHEALVRFLHYE